MTKSYGGSLSGAELHTNPMTTPGQGTDERRGEKWYKKKMENFIYRMLLNFRIKENCLFSLNFNWCRAILTVKSTYTAMCLVNYSPPDNP